MERRKVSSSNIFSVGYDAENRVLEIEFVNGGLYQYFGVPQNVVDQFYAAPSKGKFLGSSVRNKYRTKKIR
jgi:hypothetical protein